MGMDIRAEYAAGRRDFRNEDLSGAVLRGAGLYLSGRGWLRENGYSCDVRVACRRRDLLKAGDKFRCRSFRVVGAA